MLCPYCGEENNRVLRKYPSKDDDADLRVKMCMCCGQPWVTEERTRPLEKRPGEVTAAGTR